MPLRPESPAPRAARPGVEVWWVAAGTPDDGLRASLSPVEVERAAALPAREAGAFVLARALLRGVLAERLGCPPARVELEAWCPVCGRAHGRVVVGTGTTTAAHVSVTRSSPVVAVAVTSVGRVGVDLVATDAVGAAPVAGVALSAAEARAWERGGSAPTALARTWAAKEAVLKAWGTGLTVDPRDLDLGRAGRAATAGRAGHPGWARVPGTSTRVASFSPRPGVVGAVALEAARSGGARRPASGRRPALEVHDGAPVLARLREG